MWIYLKKRFRSFGYALQGIKVLIQNEPNARIHLVVALFVIGCGWGFHISLSEWMWVILCIAVVIASELFNSSIEKVCDLITENDHPHVKKIKDMSAAAVFVAAIFSFMTGMCIFIPKIFMWFKIHL